MAVIDPEPLHHILLTSIYLALEESEPEGKVAVSASEQAGSIVFTVDDECKFDDVAGGALNGRALLHTVADAILRARGGKISICSQGAGNRVEFTVPAAPREVA
jgi:signal transduction histidine kinase